MDIHYPPDVKHEALDRTILPMTLSPLPAVSPSRGHWLWLVPRLAFVLFVASVAVQLWLSERAESEEARAALISDMLWLEQSLRFNLKHNEELLANIRTAQVVQPKDFDAFSHALLTNNTGLRRVFYLEKHQPRPSVLPAGLREQTHTLVRLAHSLGKAVYSPPFLNEGGEWLFAVFVPISLADRSGNVVVGVYSMERILEDAVPWWLAQRNQIGVSDLGGQILAKRSRLEMETVTTSHQMAFDPPGHGLVLWASPIRPPATLSGKLLSATLVLLAVLVLWSLWALRRHVQQRLEAEQALREQHAFRKAMEDSLQTGLRARDLDGRITYVNPAFCRMVGWRAEELVGREPPMPYWAEEELETALAINDRILAGKGPWNPYEIRLKRRDGSTFPALVHTAPLVDASGHRTGSMSSIVDISQQKQAEELEHQQLERLQATARLVAMGEMASSLAHELNQPLAAISSYATGSLNLIEAGKTDLSEIREVLHKTREQAQRAGRILRRIYEFVRRAEPKTEPCDVAALIGEIADLVEVDARRRHIAVKRDIAPHLPVVPGDRILLGQALLNLMRNGIEAMSSQGKNERHLNVRAVLSDGQVRIEIADHGPGVPSGTLEHLFEPFFTTKSEGMGMGLNICRSIVEAHHGRLTFTPNPEGGAIFSMTLPVPVSCP